MPVYACSDTENKSGMAVTWGIFGLANFATYKYLKYWKGSTESQLKGSKYQIAFANYKSGCSKLL